MPYNDNVPRHYKLAALYRVLLPILALSSASWVPASYAADETPDADVDVIEQEQGSMAAEIKRLTEDRHHLEAKEKELQKTIKQQTEHLQEQQRALEEQSKKIERQQSTFDEQKRRLDELKVKIEDLAIPPVSPEEVPPQGEAQPPVTTPAPSAPPAQPAPPPPQAPVPTKKVPPPQQAPATAEKPPAPTPRQAPAAAEEKETPAPTGPVGRAPQPGQTRPAQIADVLEQRGILTPHGTLVVEPQFQYTNSAVTQVTLQGYTILPALLIGAINIDSVRHDTVTLALGTRYGITNHFEVEGQIPYIRRNDQTSTRPLNTGAGDETITKASGSGLGDIEIAAHYQFNDGLNGAPYLIGNLRIKSDTGKGPFDVPVDDNGLPTELPTGTGFWAVQPSFTFSLPSDPAVFFGSVSYLWSMERKVNDTIGTIKPGDAIGASLGMGLALNEDASFSLGYSHNTVAPGTQNGQTIKGSERLQVGVLLIGMSYRTGRNSSLNFGLGVGVTQDAPNVQVSLGMPLSVELIK